MKITFSKSTMNAVAYQSTFIRKSRRAELVFGSYNLTNHVTQFGGNASGARVTF